MSLENFSSIDSEKAAIFWGLLGSSIFVSIVGGVLIMLYRYDKKISKRKKNKMLVGGIVLTVFSTILQIALLIIGLTDKYELFYIANDIIETHHHIDQRHVERYKDIIPKYTKHSLHQKISNLNQQQPYSVPHTLTGPNKFSSMFKDVSITKRINFELEELEELDVSIQNYILVVIPQGETITINNIYRGIIKYIYCISGSIEGIQKQSSKLITDRDPVKMTANTDSVVMVVDLLRKFDDVVLDFINKILSHGFHYIN